MAKTKVKMLLNLGSSDAEALRIPDDVLAQATSGTELEVDDSVRVALVERLRCAVEVNDAVKLSAPKSNGK